MQVTLVSLAKYASMYFLEVIFARAPFVFFVFTIAEVAAQVARVVTCVLESLFERNPSSFLLSYSLIQLFLLGLSLFDSLLLYYSPPF